MPTLSRRAVLGGLAATGAAALTAPALAAGSPAGARARGDRRADVVVVGAGLAGLTTAYELLRSEPGLSVFVVEARNRVGGRTLNHDLGAQGFPGRVIEVGGQWVGPLPSEPATSTVPTQAVYQPQEQVYRLARELGIGTFKTYNVGQYVDYSSVTGRSTYDSSSRIPTDPGTLNAGLAIYELNEMAAKVPVDAPWTAPNALEWDGQTAETWIRENLLPHGEAPNYPTNALAALAIEAVFAAEPRDISLLHTLFYIHSAGTLDNLVDTANGAGQPLRRRVAAHRAHPRPAARRPGTALLPRPRNLPGRPRRDRRGRRLPRLRRPGGHRDSADAGGPAGLYPDARHRLR